MKYSQIINIMDNQIQFLLTHNKNLTKKQDFAIMDVEMCWSELKEKIRENNVKL